MLTLLVLALLTFAGSFGLVLALSFSPLNTICPKCRKKKQWNQHGWKSLCRKCERRAND